MSSQVSGELIVKLLILLALISIPRQEEHEQLSERFFFTTFAADGEITLESSKELNLYDPLAPWH